MSSQISRRALVSATLATTAGTAIAAAPTACRAAAHPDAALFALEPKIKELARVFDAVSLEHSRRELLHQQDREAVTKEEIDEAYDRQTEADCALLRATEELAEIPATTLDGLIFKARMWHYDEDIAEAIVRNLLAIGGRA